MAQQAELVVNLVQMAMALVDGKGRNLPRQCDDWRAHAIGGQQRSGSIQDARAGHNGECLRPSGDQSGAERHVGGGLFVTRMDDPHAIGRALRGIEQMIVVHAGKREQRIDPVRQQGFDDRRGGGQTGHGWVLQPKRRQPRTCSVPIEAPNRF